MNLWVPRWDPLTTAAIHGHAKVVSRLLRSGYGDVWSPIDPSRTEEGTEERALLGLTTPIHWAALKGNLHVLCNLIDFFGETDIDHTDADGNTALHLASGGVSSEKTSPRSSKVLEVLLSAGADPSLKNRFGNTPIDLCSNMACKSLLARTLSQRRHQHRPGSQSRSMGLLSVSKMRIENDALQSMCDDINESGLDCAQLETLRAMLETARRAFAPPSTIERATSILKQLRATEELQRAMDALIKNRPCTQSSETMTLRRVAMRVQHEGADERTLSKASRLIATAAAEIKLQECLRQCAAISCANEAHSGLRARLDRVIESCGRLGGDDRLMREATQRSTKMRVEIELQREPWTPSTDDTKGLSETQINVLTLSKRVERLSTALETACADGIGADKDLVRASKKQLVMIRAELVKANEAEEDRLREEEKKRAKAMKKGKKKKGKKGKKK